MKHRCAVCWDVQADHDGWSEHATEVHGSSLAEFGMRVCIGARERPQDRECPGITHGKKLPNFGIPSTRKPVDLSQPIKTRDGTTYTPMPLFSQDQLA